MNRFALISACQQKWLNRIVEEPTPVSPSVTSLLG